MKFLDKTGLDTLWAKIKSWFARKENGVYYVVGTHSYTAYSASATYTKYTSGAYTSANSCVYNGVAYYCSTAITTPEAWTSSHWTKIATPTWEGTIDGVTELVAGLKISYKIPIAGGQSSTYLNINNLGNKYVKRCTGQTTTHLPVNTVVFMTYDGTQWVWADYSVGDNYYVIPDVFCTTAAGTQAKAATSIGFNHDRHKNIPFRIYFTNTNSYNGNLTLNINSQGEKALWINGSASSSSNKTISVGVYWCYFDGTQYQLWTDKTMPSPIAVRGPVVTRTFTSVSKVTDDTRWRRVARLKFGNEYNYCYVTLLVNNFFWNGQQKSSHLLYIACNNDGSQSTKGVVNSGKIKLMGDDIVFKIDRTNLGSAIAPANRYADLYLQYPTTGNSSGDWSVSVLNISNHAFDKIEWANNSETNQTLPEDCVEIDLAGQISSAATATKATQDSDGNAINATYFKATTGTTTLQSGTAVKVGTQNGADVNLKLPTIPAAANNGALKIGLNGGTATSKFTANQSGDSTLTFASGTAVGTIKVDGTDVAVNGAQTGLVDFYDITVTSSTNTMSGATYNAIAASITAGRMVFLRNGGNPLYRYLDTTSDKLWFYSPFEELAINKSANNDASHTFTVEPKSDSSLSGFSKNSVQNRVVKAALDGKQNDVKYQLVEYGAVAYSDVTTIINSGKVPVVYSDNSLYVCDGSVYTVNSTNEYRFMKASGNVDSPRITYLRINNSSGWGGSSIGLATRSSVTDVANSRFPYYTVDNPNWDDLTAIGEYKVTNSDSTGTAKNSPERGAINARVYNINDVNTPFITQIAVGDDMYYRSKYGNSAWSVWRYFTQSNTVRRIEQGSLGSATDTLYIV